MLDGDRHREERRLLVHAFRGEHMSAHAATVREVAQGEIGRWRPGDELVIHDAMQAITLDVILRIVFGMTGDALDSVRGPMDQFLRDGGSFRVLIPFLRRDLGPLTPWARFVRNRDLVRRAVLDAISARRNDPDLGDRLDVLSLLLRADVDGGWEDAALLDELMTMLLAGQDTTATALSWALDLLLHHPETLAWLVAALRAGHGEAELEAVIQETLRLRPVIPEVGRVLLRPMRLCDYEIPASASVIGGVLLARHSPCSRCGRCCARS